MQTEARKAFVGQTQWLWPEMGDPVQMRGGGRCGIICDRRAGHGAKAECLGRGGGGWFMFGQMPQQDIADRGAADINQPFGPRLRIAAASG